jgi:type II restriction/modification system DNA methylase subunit YeeA
VVKSEDIPAATQLFTPNWIVQYLVQNSVGRLWLMANPHSTLAKEWPYYITPAEQTPEVQAQLDALIQTRVQEDGDTLNPESITVLDPACGSGHILVVAYDVLKAIYLERGYQPRAIPRLILEKNLFGLDLDDRAAQMAGFALLMKARADDRRLFTATDDAGNLHPPKLNVLSLQESKGLSVDELATHLAPFKVQRTTITGLVETSEHAKTFGSLIQIPYALKTHLTVLPEVLALVKQSGELYANASADDLLPLVRQAQMLAMHFDAVIANPPYMGGKGMNPELKEYAKRIFPDSKVDLFAMFMERGFEWCKPSGFNSMVTMQSWMFLSSYEAMREKLLLERTLQNMAHLGARAFGEISGEVVQTTAFTFLGRNFPKFKPVFFRLVDGQEADKESALLARESIYCTILQEDFKKIPGSPLAYWVSPAFVKTFVEPSFESITISDGQNKTGNNDKFVREFWEVNIQNVGIKKKWFLYAKGGGFRRWAGNLTSVVDWSDSARAHYKSDHVCRIIPEYLWLKTGVTWSFITTATPSFRILPHEATFDVGGSSIFFKDDKDVPYALAVLNSNFATKVLSVTNPTVNVQVKNVRDIPVLKNSNKILIEENAIKAIEISQLDWNCQETALDFTRFSIAYLPVKVKRLAESWNTWKSETEERISRLKALERANNSLFIESYGLGDELTAEISEDQITLVRADREKDCQRLISYAIGCMMGRYSLDESGLIYAHAGNVGFEPSHYATYPADTDGIVPITDELWFADDAPSRMREFLRAIWGPDTLEENMAWLAESLGAKSAETPDETIRRYIADKFFKDHLQTYKKRPIYWLFSSGKQGAFQALVYLHRYTEGTVARLRAEYVVPLTGKIQGRIDMLQKDTAAASSTAARNKLVKEVEKLKKKHVELLAYDEQLRHYADMRITLNLDDGVNVNYGKFGDLLAEVKAITGGASDD